MTKKGETYRCLICGNVVTVIEAGAGRWFAAASQ
jgi:desulfoferrodoxin-like iron-binding protein